MIFNKTGAYIVVAVVVMYVGCFSVCRSCIVKYLQDNDDNQCPICAILIHETNPFDMLRYLSPTIGYLSGMIVGAKNRGLSINTCFLFFFA